MIILFDWDGTLCETPPGIDYDDEPSLLARCSPRIRGLEHVRAAAAAGHQVGVVTARGPHVANATRAQLQAWLPDIVQSLVGVHHRPRLVFDLRHYVADKEASIRQLGGQVYVGDRDEDRAAALRAGARFLWDHQWEQHGLRLLPREVTP